MSTCSALRDGGGGRPANAAAVSGLAVGNLAATPPCPEPYDRCYDSAPGYTACGITCVDDSECPAPLTGDAVATCAGPQNDICVLDCAGGVVCPDGMECVDVVGGAFHRCVWPDPV